MAHDDLQQARERGIRDTLENAGVGGALDEALEAENRIELPAGTAELAPFLETALLDALAGRVHPRTARALVDTLIARWAAPAPHATARDGAATVPPPPMQGDEGAYADLATGAVHTRPTPVWDLAHAMGPGTDPPVWMIVSRDMTLGELARRSAPSGTEVISISSMAVLKGALARADGPASCIVLDATAPSIPLDRAVAALVEGALGTRVVLWRMADKARNQLCAAVPHARSWLSFEDDVTAREIVQLLRV